jgi:hypothetical protein
MGIHVMAEDAVVSWGSVPMRPKLIQCHSGMSKEGDQKSTTFGESTSRRSSDCRVWKLSALGVVPGDSTEVWGEIHKNRGRVGEERGGKETDGYPLTQLISGFSTVLMATSIMASIDPRHHHLGDLVLEQAVDVLECQ